MAEWINDLDPHQVAEANRKYYSLTSQVYDVTETCVVSLHSQQILEDDISNIIRMLDRPPEDMFALDACGGSGNVTQKLLKKGLKVTLCDISPELTKLCIAKTQKYKADLSIVNSEIGDFLRGDSKSYDLIVFSSALHHLRNYSEVLYLSYKRLKSGGFVYTIFDPTPSEHLILAARVLLGLDYLLFKTRNQPFDLISGMMRRFRRFTRSLFNRPVGSKSTTGKSSMDLNADYLGFVAEFYARTGIDDLELANQLKEMGYRIVLHDRYAEARHELFRKILDSLGQITSFKFIIQKPS